MHLRTWESDENVNIMIVFWSDHMITTYHIASEPLRFRAEDFSLPTYHFTYIVILFFNSYF